MLDNVSENAVETVDTSTAANTAADFPVYVQDTDGKWILSQQAKDWSKALYYSGRLAYSKENSRIAIGKYNSNGEVIPFQRYWENTSQQ